MSYNQETAVAVGLMVLLMGLLALLLRRMARSREIDVQEDFWLDGPLEQVSLRLPSALRKVPGLRVETLDSTTFHLVRRVTPGWVYATFLVIGIFSVILVAMVKVDRRTWAILVADQPRVLLRVGGRLNKEQVPALRSALAPMTTRA